MILGGECQKPAAWHIIWATGGGSRGSMACVGCMHFAIENDYAYIEAHPYAPPCDDLRALWFRAESTCRRSRGREDDGRGTLVL